MLACRSCGHGNPDGSRFCNSCGAALDGDVPTRDLRLEPTRLLDAPAAGTVLDGRYRLDREIGRGAFGVVFEAADVAREKRVAVKLLNAHLAHAGPDAARFRERFAREWTAGSRLDHPGVVRMLETGAHAGVPFIVMELVHGETLAALIGREQVLPLARSIAIVGDVLDALGHAHAAGIVHRDVKPSNVIVDESGRARLMDFGVAKLMEGLSGSLMSQTGLLGTPSYMSPEQAGGQRIDARSDLFAVGLVAYELFTGRRAFKGHPGEVIGQILSRPVPAARQLPPELRGWLARACAQLPDERFGSASEMARALVEVARAFEARAGRVAAPSTPPAALRARGTWGGRRVLQVAFMLVFAALLLPFALRAPRRGAAPRTVPAAAPAGLDEVDAAATGGGGKAQWAVASPAAAPRESVMAEKASAPAARLADEAPPPPPEAMAAPGLSAARARQEDHLVGEIEADAVAGWRLVYRLADEGSARRLVDAVRAEGATSTLRAAEPGAEAQDEGAFIVEVGPIADRAAAEGLRVRLLELEPAEGRLEPAPQR